MHKTSLPFWWSGFRNSILPKSWGVFVCFSQKNQLWQGFRSGFYLRKLSYYKTKRGLKPFHFRNIGERKIKKILESKEYKISRSSFRFISQTWHYIPVITSADMGVIFEETLEYLFLEKQLWNILTEEILRSCDSATDTITNNLIRDCLYSLLRFQYDSAVRCRNRTQSERKKQILRKIITAWEKCPMVSEIHKTCAAHKSKANMSKPDEKKNNTFSSKEAQASLKEIHLNLEQTAANRED